MADKKDHYTAVIEIHRVTEAHSIEGTSNYNRGAKIEVPRETKEVTRLVIRAGSIEKLVEKATAHLELVEEN